MCVYTDRGMLSMKFKMMPAFHILKSKFHPKKQPTAIRRIAFDRYFFSP